MTGALARENPFSTDRVLRIRYRFASGSLQDLMSRLADLQFRAAIVGLEGTGKTTLLEDLEQPLHARGFCTKPIRLTYDNPHFPRGFAKRFFRELTRRDIILFDGAEQMGSFAWRQFRYRSRKAAGLIITSHREGLLPTAIQCETSPDLLQQIIAELTESECGNWAGCAPSLFDTHRGNLREALRELYDAVAEGRMTTNSNPANNPSAAIQTTRNKTAATIADTSP